MVRLQDSSYLESVLRCKECYVSLYYPKGTHVYKCHCLDLRIVILTSLLVVVCSLQDVNRDYDHGELMASFLPVKTAK